MSRELTVSWLTHNAARYRNPSRVSADVLAALDRFATLRPKTDVYTYDDGRTQLLLCLHGLIPISFRNVSYNIPVALWLTLPYPAEPPLAYVVPTSDMLVKPSPHIDLSGRCTLEYTANWSRKSDACSISVLLEVMQAHFSREPPLYAKPRPKPSSAVPDHDHVIQLTQTPHPPRLPPKPPSVLTHVNSAPASSPILSAPSVSQSYSGLHQSSPGVPPSLPQTHAPAYSSYTSYATTTDSRVNLQQQRLPVPAHLTGHGPNPSPVPALVSAPAQGQSAQGPPPYVSAYHSVSPRPPVPPSPFAYTGHQRGASISQDSHIQSPLNTPSPPPPSHLANSHSQSSPLQAQIPGPSSTAALPAPAAGYAHPSIYQLPASPSAPEVSSFPSVGPTRPPPSLPPPDLLDEDDDTPTSSSGASTSLVAPVPPRPPNPQTLALHSALLAALRDALTRLTTSHADTLARQRAQQAELLAGPGALRDECARLAAVRDVCRAVGARWGMVVREGEGVLSDVRRRGEVAVDEMVCASSIVGNQLINLVAEDNAIEDTMYHLHRALNSGRIDLERFLRTTRVLAEEQFMKRALVDKIVRGLPMKMCLG